MSVETPVVTPVETITRTVDRGTRVTYARVDDLVRWMLDSNLPDVAKAIASLNVP